MNIVVLRVCERKVDVMRVCVCVCMCACVSALQEVIGVMQRSVKRNY